MKKIAVPTIDGKLCTHFGHCEKFAIITVDNDVITEEQMHVPPVHQPGVYPKWLHDLGVTEIIAGGMGQKAKDIFDHNDILVHVGVQSKPAKEAVEDLIRDELTTGQNRCDH
ncbi:MAG: NifB/NifX family molybdenum-iron cluster-binding protein [Bacteroidales bacterium]